jgi:hypothetical protein
MSRFPDKLRLKGQAEEDLYFARRERELLAGRRSGSRAVADRALRVVSGGQTGVDRAALDAALASGVMCGGWCPAGRAAEDGVIPASYPLTETSSSDPAERTERNVRDSDATLILRRGGPSGGSSRGTDLTARAARRLGRPLLVRDLSLPVDTGAIVTWLRINRIGVLNCAGPRESEAPGIEVQARALLLEVFRLWSAGDP